MLPSIWWEGAGYIIKGDAAWITEGGPGNHYVIAGVVMVAENCKDRSRIGNPRIHPKLPCRHETRILL